MLVCIFYNKLVIIFNKIVKIALYSTNFVFFIQIKYFGLYLLVVVSVHCIGHWVDCNWETKPYLSVKIWSSQCMQKGLNPTSYAVHKINQKKWQEGTVQKRLPWLSPPDSDANLMVAVLWFFSLHISSYFLLYFV